MATDFDSLFLGRRINSFVLAASFAALTLTGCSSVPDAVNPVEWYKGTVDYLAGDDEDEAAGEQATQQDLDAKAGAAESKGFPNLASVPERKAKAPSQGLVGDPRPRRYATDVIQRQGEASNALVENTAPTAPPPPAVPTTPVTAQPLGSAAPAQMAAAQPAPLPATQGPTDVMDVYRQRLSQTRPMGQKDTGAPLAEMRAGPGAFDDFGTVVIDGSGIAQGGTAAAQPAAPLASSPAVAVDMGTIGRTAPVSNQGMVKVATILFGNGSSKLTRHDRGILKKVRDLQRQYGARIHVVGHASSRTRNMDPVRHKMVNYEVSVERAGIVAGELKRLGLDGAIMTVDARSDSDPLYYEIMPSGEAGNRRAEVYLIF